MVRWRMWPLTGIDERDAGYICFPRNTDIYPLWLRLKYRKEGETTTMSVRSVDAAYKGIAREVWDPWMSEDGDQA
jgi:hypothetical protein